MYNKDVSTSTDNQLSRWPNFKLVLPYIEPSELDQDLYLVVVVNSAATGENHRLLRTTIRNTWGRSDSTTQHQFKWRLYFALGKSTHANEHSVNLNEAASNNDVIIGNFTDVYENVVTKTYMSHFWAVRRFTSCKYILKTDDDVYVRIGSLVQWLSHSLSPRPFYGGYVSPFLTVPRDHNSKWFVTREQYSDKNWPPFCHGAFHVISSDIVPDILNFTKLKRPIINDDAFIGVSMRSIGVQAIQIPGFQIDFKHPKRERTDCELLTTKAIGHKLDTNMMVKFHSFYRSSSHIHCSMIEHFFNKFKGFFRAF